MPTINNITATIVQSVLTVTVSWDTTDIGALVVYDAAGIAVPGTVTSSGPGFAVWQPGAGAMIAGQPYWLQVSTQQVPSAKVPLLWTPVTNVASSFDGAMLTVSWTAPAGRPTPGFYNVTLASGANMQSVQAVGTSAAFAPVPAFSGDGWTITVAPTLAVSTGPAASGTVVTGRVALAGVACTATAATTGQLAITPAASSYTSFQATLSQNGAVVVQQVLAYTAGQPMLLPIAAGTWPLSPLGGYAVAIRPVSGSATGPQGAALPVVATAPVILSAAVSGVAAPEVSVMLALPPGVPAATGFSASVSNGSSVVGSAALVGDGGSFALTGALVEASYVLTVAASAGANSTGPTAQITLLSAAPTLTSIDNSEGLLTIGFGIAKGATITQADVYVAGAIVATGQTAGATLSLPAPANGVAFGVALRAVAPRLLGPMLGPVAALGQAPVAQGAAFDLAGAATVGWLVPAALPAPTGYTIESYDGARISGSATATGAATASAPLPAGGQIKGAAAAATVRATGKDDATGAVLTGPRSLRVPVLVNAPQSLTVRFDGATAQIAWSAPAGAQVDGYLVTLTDAAGGVAAVSQRVDGTTLSVAYAAAAASVVTVAVQATGGNALGPAATVPLFAPALFASTDITKAASLAPSASLNFGRQPLAILLPEIFQTHQATPPTSATFALATTAIAPWRYLLTIGEVDSVWNFDASAIRAPLLADFAAFMLSLAAAGLTPRGDLLLRQALARVLPMTFVETLFYAYNFNVADGGAGQGQGLVDLTPGMVLRVELESYQSLPPAAQTGNAGMVGTGFAEYEIGGYGSGQNWRQGFDGFLSQLVGHGMAVPPPQRLAGGPTQSGAGGAPDFYYPLFLQPFYRLIYPPAFLSSVDIAVSNNLRSNATLIAAPTRADLDTATATLRNSSGSYQPVNALYFRGRAMISPRIHVLFNGNDITVPLGTTVANLLDRYASLAAAGGREAQLRVGRALNGVAVQGWPSALTAAVRLDWTGGRAAPDGTSWMDLPLLHGDRVDLALR